MSWLAVWMRAVIVPSARRALPVWLGAGIVAAVIFGGTGMQPHDLTQLTLHAPSVAIALGVTWLLLYVPVARLLVRDDATRFLRSLPHRSPTAIVVVALIVFQLPWLALWLVGEHVLGLVLATAFTPIIASVALWRPRPPHAAHVRWLGATSALRQIYARALVRRAGDALIRAAGLGLLAGGAAGLFVRNNQLEPEAAGVLATAVIAVVLVPGWVAALLPLVEAHRASAWLAQSLGISEQARLVMLGWTIWKLYVAATVIAIVPAALLLGDVPTILAVAGIALATATALAVLVTRFVVWAERSVAVAARVVIGALVASALAVILLGWLGGPGVVALAAVGALAWRRA
ncbi:MAG: hypothetical protein ABI591_16935 [Kofleriaceae bacterium]